MTLRNAYRPPLSRASLFNDQLSCTVYVLPRSAPHPSFITYALLIPTTNTQVALRTALAIVFDPVRLLDGNLDANEQGDKFALSLILRDSFRSNGVLSSRTDSTATLNPAQTDLDSPGRPPFRSEALTLENLRNIVKWKIPTCNR